MYFMEKVGVKFMFVVFCLLKVYDFLILWVFGDGKFKFIFVERFFSFGVGVFFF